MSSNLPTSWMALWLLFALTTGLISLFLNFLLCPCFVTHVGRSNAINIAERLGLPLDIVESSRHLLGTAGAEINAVCFFGHFSALRTCTWLNCCPKYLVMILSSPSSSSAVDNGHGKIQTRISTTLSGGTISYYVRMSLYIDLCTLQFYVWVCCDSLSTPHILAFFSFYNIMFNLYGYTFFWYTLCCPLQWVVFSWLHLWCAAAGGLGALLFCWGGRSFICCGVCRVLSCMVVLYSFFFSLSLPSNVTCGKSLAALSKKIKTHITDFEGCLLFNHCFLCLLTELWVHIFSHALVCKLLVSCDFFMRWTVELAVKWYLLSINVSGSPRSFITTWNWHKRTL